MNPFDLPPAGAPVSVDAPAPSTDPTSGRPRRGRTALVAVLTLGLVGGGVAGVSQFASADRPELATAAQDEPSDDTVAPVDDGSNDESGEVDPVVVDLDDLDIGDLDIGRIGDLTECIGLPSFGADGQFGEFTPDDWNSGEFPLDLEELFDGLPFDLEALEELDGDWPIELGDLGGFGGFGVDGGNVTVVGPDGVSVVELGENGSVTVTADDGAISVATTGDATVSELDDLLGEFGSILERGPALFDDELFDDELFESLPRLETIDADAIQSCIDEVLGN